MKYLPTLLLSLFVLTGCFSLASARKRPAVAPAAAPAAAAKATPPIANPNGVVMIDIGHQSTSGGAASPDGKVSEYEFWCTYAGEVKAVIEAAGYPCVVVNRSVAPTKKHVLESCRAAGVVQLNRPDKGAVRYPSKYYPQHIGCGMIAADYAIEQKARCMVFLHLNSVSSKWSDTPPTGLIICNRKYGHGMAEAVCATMRSDILDRPGGMPNAGKGIKVLPRYIGSQPSAGWMNALDESRIPAIVFEAVYVNNRAHVDYIRNDANARKLARTIAKGVVNWLKSNS